MSVSQNYAKIINNAFEVMFDISDARCRDNPKNPSKYGMEYPSDVITPLLLASEVFDEIASNDLLLRKKLRILLQKQLNPPLKQEIKDREIFKCLLNRELAHKPRSLSIDEESLFKTIEDQYRSVSILYNLPYNGVGDDVSKILSSHNESFRVK